MAVIEQSREARVRPCEWCDRPYGKWTCCGHAYCNLCVLLHWSSGWHKSRKEP